MASNKNNHKLLLAVLGLQAVAVAVYTLFAIRHDGWNFIGVFLDNVYRIGWTGQFHLDFACYLLLSAWWVMWRRGYDWQGITAGVAAAILGIVFFAPYVVYLLFVEKGNMIRLLTGVHAAQRKAQHPLS